MKVVAEAADGEEAAQLTDAFRPDVAIVDIAMPYVDGIEATKQIKALSPSTAVLILSAHDDDQFVFSILEAGAAGYMLKRIRGAELVEAVRAVSAGESVLHPAVAHKVLNRFIPSRDKPKSEEKLQALTKRETEILKLVTRGLSNKEVGDELCISRRTVQGALARIFGKLGVASRTEAVVRALREGWVTVDDLPQRVQ
jgi:DNA-binding NarL/FixJ family response regulator